MYVAVYHAGKVLCKRCVYVNILSFWQYTGILLMGCLKMFRQVWKPECVRAWPES